MRDDGLVTDLGISTTDGSARVPRPGGLAATYGPLFVGLVFWILLPLLCVATLIIGSVNLVTKIDRVPAGILGSYQVTSHSCHQELCITGGTFTSTTGNVVETNLFGSYEWQLGTAHPAIYNDDAADVIPLPGRWDPTATILGMTGALAFIAVWGWCLLAHRRRRRELSTGAG
jgi:hypothetical protein